MESNRSSLQADEAKHAELTDRKAAIEAKKREVEDGIMRGLSAENSPVTPGDGRTNGSGQRDSMGSVEPERPDVEELTPPPPESTTPTNDRLGPSDEYEPPHSTADPVSFASPLPSTVSPPVFPPATAGSDLLSSLNVPAVRSFSGSGSEGGGAAKRRRLDDEADVFGVGGGDAMADLDEDVAELLRAESGGR